MIFLTTASAKCQSSINARVKGQRKVEIKDYLIQHGQYLARVFLIRYLSDF